MRIATQGQTVDSVPSSNANMQKKIVTTTKLEEQPFVETQAVQVEEQELSKEKIQLAVDSLNDFLEINNSSSKFVLHEGLNRYFVQVVDAKTDEVVKEIPAKKLLDAFYEMQKLVGMIVDKKI